jgi:2-polyprenyl-3-methyl-5-hydroxy-6-metoxy-1,4-benzoquinol methylase
MTTYDYDEIPVGYYDDIFHRDKGVQSKWHQLKFKRVHQEMGTFSQHLDIGCGPGTLISALNGNGTSTGVDTARRQIDYANSKYASPTKIFQSITPGPLPFDDAGFDLATLVELIEHIEDDACEALLGEAFRVLKPGGKMIVSTPNYQGLWPMVEALVNKLGDVSYEEQHINKFTNNRLVNLLQKIGLQNVQVSGYMFASPFGAALGWKISDAIEKIEPDWLVNKAGLLLIGTGTKAL